MTEPIKYALSPDLVRVIRDRIFGFRDTKAVLSPFLTDVSEDSITATQEGNYIVVDYAYHCHQGKAQKRVRKHLYLRWNKFKYVGALSFNLDHIEVSRNKFPVPEPEATSIPAVNPNYKLTNRQVKVLNSLLWGGNFNPKPLLEASAVEGGTYEFRATLVRGMVVVDFSYYFIPEGVGRLTAQGRVQTRLKRHVYFRWQVGARISVDATKHIQVSRKPFPSGAQVAPTKPQEMPLRERLLRDLEALLTCWDSVANAMGCDPDHLSEVARARATSMRAREVIAQKASADWTKPTTKLQRMSDAVTLLCDGKRPSDRLVQGWLDKTDEGLRDFAATHGPAWAQGIGVLDAAAVLADTPTEGVDHLDVS